MKKKKENKIVKKGIEKWYKKGIIKSKKTLKICH